jgi:hypothetical protein
MQTDAYDDAFIIKEGTAYAEIVLKSKCIKALPVLGRAFIL